jgi:hypothetical protein
MTTEGHPKIHGDWDILSAIPAGRPAPAGSWHEPRSRWRRPPWGRHSARTRPSGPRPATTARGYGSPSCPACPSRLSPRSASQRPRRADDGPSSSNGVALEDEGQEPPRETGVFDSAIENKPPSALRRALPRNPWRCRAPHPSAPPRPDSSETREWDRVAAPLDRQRSLPSADIPPVGVGRMVCRRMPERTIPDVCSG